MFRKTGDAPIVGVFCKCGYQLKSKDEKCPNCSNDLKKCGDCCKECKEKEKEENDN